MKELMLVVGDVHLGKGVSIGKPGIGAELNSRILDQMKLLDWVLQQAIEKHVNYISFTGDIFDNSKPDFRLVVWFLDYLKRCDRAGMGVYIVAGNHDIKRMGQSYVSVLDIITTAELFNVKVFKDIHTEFFSSGATVTFLPYRDRTGLEYKTNQEGLDHIREQIRSELVGLDSLNSKAMLIGHMALEGALFVGDESDNMFNELMCPIDMFDNYSLTIMGHVHKPQTQSNKPYMGHIGSLDLSDFGETDQIKEIYLIDFDNLSSFDRIPVPSRPLRKVSIEIPSEIDITTTQYVTDKLIELSKEKPFKDAIVRLELSFDDANADITKRNIIEKHLSDLGAFHICNYSESRNTVVVPLSKQQDIDNTIDPKAAVLLFAEQETFESDEQKEKYIDLSNKLIEEWLTNQAK
jgi:DNA repair exonuclease SbcCD nuclease subunit